jgi:hypothetical protein
MENEPSKNPGIPTRCPCCGHPAGSSDRPNAPFIAPVIKVDTAFLDQLWVEWRKAQSDWQEEVCRQFMPEVIPMLSTPAGRRLAAHYVKAEGFEWRYHYHDGKIELAKGDTILATYNPPQLPSYEQSRNQME